VSVPAKPFISRAAVAGRLLSVVCVLGLGCRAKIRLAIVQPITVDMVNKHAGGHFENLAVHAEVTLLALFGGKRANRVERRALFGGVPFMSGQPEEIIRIDDGELALGQRYPAERIAVPEPPIQKHRLYSQPVQPGWDFNTESDDSRRHGLVIGNW